MAGYSGIPLIQKLGIKNGFTIRIINRPGNYAQLLGRLPPDVHEGTVGVDFTQLFTTQQSEYRKLLPHIKQASNKDGMIWICWPKKSSGVKTDLNENIIRDVALEEGLVDVKVAAIDDTWSGLKLVYRLKDR